MEYETIKKEFADVDTVVLALSPDSTARLMKFEEKQDLNFDLLSDEDHTVAEKWSLGFKKELRSRVHGNRALNIYRGKRW